MTPEELYRHDVNGYLLIEDAIPREYLERINRRIDVWEKKAAEALRERQDKSNPEVRYDDVLNQEEILLDLAANPKVLPYIDEMVERPRLKSTWLTFKFKGGRTHFHSNHTPSVTHNFYHFNGQIRHNLLDIFYALRDIKPGGGGLTVIPGSHKANYQVPRNGAVENMKVEIPMKAGSALLFSHDVHHGSLNTLDDVRRTLIFTYCPGVISNSYGGDGLYDRLFEQAPEGSWLKYLVRRPNGFRETYPRPAG